MKKSLILAAIVIFVIVCVLAGAIYRQVRSARDGELIRTAALANIVRVERSLQEYYTDWHAYPSPDRFGVSADYMAGSHKCTIVYLRCRNSGLIHGTTSNPCICSADSTGPAYYDLGELRSIAAQHPEFSTPKPPVNPKTGVQDFKDWTDYFSNHSLDAPGQPRQPRMRDAYLLISPGPDGIFGTSDDIANDEGRR